MRTTLWSLAFLAGNVLAAPGVKRDGAYGYESSSSCTEEEGISTASPESSSVHQPAGPGSYTYSFSRNSSSVAGPTGGVGKPVPSVTLITTTYTTVCPEETTHVAGGTTLTETYTITKTITDVITAPISGPTPPAYVPHLGGAPPKGGAPHYGGKGPHGGSGPSSPDHSPPNGGSGSWPAPAPAPHKGGEGSGPYPITTCKEVTTVYTTVYPVTTTAAQEGHTITRTYQITSTITSTFTTTLTIGYGGGPGGHAPAETTSAPVYGGSPPGHSAGSSSTSTPGVIGGGIWTTIKWGTTYLSFTIPSYTKTSSTPASGPSFTGSFTSSPTPSFPGSLRPSNSSFPGSLRPSTSSFSGSLRPSTPSFSGSLRLSTPSFSGSLRPSTPSVSGSLRPSTPSVSGSLRPSTPSVSGSKRPSTPSVSGSKRPTPSFSGSLRPTPSVPASLPPKSSSTITTTTSTTSTSTCSKPTSTYFPSSPDLSNTVSDLPAHVDSSCTPCEGQPGSDPASYCGYTVNDNSYQVTPKTCTTKYFDFTLTNTTVNPDGIERLGLLINGQMPGPKIEANWGDTIVVRVTNKLQNNGTSIHFHGMRQLNTNEMDGVASITQCPIAPGDTMTYTFKALNYGTSWYHSHFALQTYEGIFGPMVIHGPASETYDDEEMIVIQDWSHDTVDSKYAIAQDVVLGGPQTLDNGLINGKGVLGSGANATGSYFQMNVVSGKIYRIRLVNTAIQSTFKFHIDGHTFKVIAADFVPIVPYETDILNINIGQRYDLIMTADQPIANYWMRSDNQQPCAQLKQPNTLGVVSYVGATGTPTTTAKTYVAECVDEPYASLVPVVPINAGVATVQEDYINKTIVIGPNGGTPNLFKWTLSGTTFQSQWGQPTLQQIVENGTVPTFSGDLAIQVPNLHEWVYVIIDSPVPLPHPIHLHGHDFLVLAQGTGLYNSDVQLNLINPPRRDVAFMPWDPTNHLGGHLVLAFESDNPGVWLMHCHIGWHTSMGFALQIIENLEGINKTVTNSCGVEDTCKNWATYAADFDIHVDDSGV